LIPALRLGLDDAISMSIGILLITHPGVGSALLTTASRLLAACPTRIKCLDVPLDANPESIFRHAAREVLNLDDGDGVLILTDAYGSTPSNIACQLTEDHYARVVSGLNLPMLIRVFNYFTEDLDTLSHKAAEGGIRGIQTFDSSAGCEFTT